MSLPVPVSPRINAGWLVVARRIKSRFVTAT
jgi:hypothetical protein